MNPVPRVRLPAGLAFVLLFPAVAAIDAPAPPGTFEQLSVTVPESTVAARAAYLDGTAYLAIQRARPVPDSPDILFRWELWAYREIVGLRKIADLTSESTASVPLSIAERTIAPDRGIHILLAPWTLVIFDPSTGLLTPHAAPHGSPIPGPSMLSSSRGVYFVGDDWSQQTNRAYELGFRSRPLAHDVGSPVSQGATEYGCAAKEERPRTGQMWWIGQPVEYRTEATLWSVGRHGAQGPINLAWHSVDLQGIAVRGYEPRSGIGSFESCAAAWTGDCIYIMGGKERPRDIVTLDTTARTFHVKGTRLPVDMWDHGAVWTGESFLLFGGRAPNEPGPTTVIGSFYKYTPASRFC